MTRAFLQWRIISLLAGSTSSGIRKKAFATAVGWGWAFTAIIEGAALETRLMEAALAKAKQSGLIRVELTVYDSNAMAIALYQKCGFVEEGRMVKARYLDGRFEDILNMAVIFPEEFAERR